MTQKQKNFIKKIGVLASADMQKSGVLASLTIAQAILESAWGESGLTKNANALFGIKAGKSWKGKAYSAKTKECYDGVSFTTITALFRAYDSWEESIADHSALLTGAKRYKEVIGETDYKAACKAIAAAGYATDPGYADKLIQIIEEYSLTAYDTTPPTEEKAEINTAKSEMLNRANLVAHARKFYGAKESDGTHKEIIDIYNADAPLPRNYRMKYADAWCACFVSVVAISAGATAIMPKECSCAKMIDLYKEIGCWQEKDDYTPEPGDVIFYDWQDSGAGDNAGHPDHVGIVDTVTGSTIKVIEGNITDSVGYRRITVGAKTIRGFGLPRFDTVAISAPAGSNAESNADAVNTPTVLSFGVGDVVKFTGTKHYASSTTATAKTCKSGTAKVTATAEGEKHPYHLVKEPGGSSTVYGWVNASDVEALPDAPASNGSMKDATAKEIKRGSKIQYSGPVYRDSNGNGKGRTIKGTYTVQYYYNDRKCGVHIAGLGWVPESDCVAI